jgi:hypothetical protein
VVSLVYVLEGGDVRYKVNVGMAWGAIEEQRRMEEEEGRRKGFASQVEARRRQ